MKISRFNRLCPLCKNAFSTNHVLRSTFTENMTYSYIQCIKKFKVIEDHRNIFIEKFQNKSNELVPDVSSNSKHSVRLPPIKYETNGDNLPKKIFEEAQSPITINDDLHDLLNDIPLKPSSSATSRKKEKEMLQDAYRNRGSSEQQSIVPPSIKFKCLDDKEPNHIVLTPVELIISTPLIDTPKDSPPETGKKTPPLSIRDGSRSRKTTGESNDFRYDRPSSPIVTPTYISTPPSPQFSSRNINDSPTKTDQEYRKVSVESNKNNEIIKS